MSKDKNKESKQEKEISVKAGKTSAGVPAEQRFEQLFDDLFSRRFPRLLGADWPSLRWPEVPSLTDKSIEARAPKVDVVDRENEVMVRAELPGIDKEDIEVSVSDNSVSISGSTRKESETEKDQYHRREIVSSYVSRTVPLGCEVDGERAAAKLKDGLLEITIPKVEKSKRKRVEIES